MSENNEDLQFAFRDDEYKFFFFSISQVGE